MSFQTGRALLGEGLTYIKSRNLLYWIDILGNKVFSYNLATCQYSEWSLPDSIFKYPSAILPTTDPNKFVIPAKDGTTGGNKLIFWDQSLNNSDGRLTES